MRTTMRERNRWFTAVAMTCLSGFALCGCTRGNRDLSSNLPESAGREAIDAERHVAERKRQESGSSKAKDQLAYRNEEPELSDPSEDPQWDAPGVVSKESKTTAPHRVRKENSDLETAEWAGEYLDRRVKTVSEEKTAETAEPLLNSPPPGAAATELFNDEEEGTVHIKKSAQKAAHAAEAQSPPPGNASFDGTSEHPWAKKSPGESRTKTAEQLSTKSRDESSVSSTGPHPEPKKSVQASSSTDQPSQDNARQSEARARIQTLITQAKSLLNKEEFRSAYRVAQLAQRVADSEDVYFVAGEEQPADIVRLVLTKIRLDQHSPASLPEETTGGPVVNASATKPAGRKSPSNLPEDWPFAEWKEGEGIPVNRSQKMSVENPWAEGGVEPSAKTMAQMRIEPGPSRKGSRSAVGFPNSRPEWKNTAKTPLAQSHSSDVTQPGLADTRLGDKESQVVQADLSSPPSAQADMEENVTSASTGRAPVPRPFPASASPGYQRSRPSEELTTEPLAMTDSWRTQDLDAVGPTRLPLLVAPLPPAEVPGTEVLNELAEDTLSTDIHEPSSPTSESKLWLILAAAAGAFAMLFVRRQPAAVVRTLDVVKSAHLNS